MLSIFFVLKMVMIGDQLTSLKAALFIVIFQYKKIIWSILEQISDANQKYIRKHTLSIINFAGLTCAWILPLLKFLLKKISENRPRSQLGQW